MAKKRTKRDIPRPHAGGTMTDAERHAFFMGLIRDGLRRWKPKHECIKGAYCSDAINPKTGRKVKMYACCHCMKLHRQKEMRADHIEPLVPLTGFVSWDDTFARAFVEVDGFQPLCKGCHSTKTAEERKLRKHFISA